MPELPEVEHLKRTLEPTLLGAAITDVRVHRADIVRCSGDQDGRIAKRCSLLLGRSIDRLERRGKQLAIISDHGGIICIHLGMSGQCWVHDPAAVNNGILNNGMSTHIHCRWRMHTAHGERELLFRDPRRFGGLWTYPSRDRLLTHRWATLGPDALTITGPQLRQRIEQTKRPIKAVLLDQRTIAGIGNIYADEALFAANIHPLTQGCLLSREQTNALAGAIRHTLRRAIDRGGSTLRDYRDGTGRAGQYQSHHAVYGRAGLPCRRCRTVLISAPVTQRTTVHCPTCQGTP